MKSVLLFLILIVTMDGFAQQDAIYSQYNYNQYVLNPAYAGSRNSMSAILLHRSRWTGVEGAPTTSTFSIHAPVNKSNIAWGANVARDQLGATTNILMGFAGAYHLKLNTGKLAFGLRAGLYSTNLNAAQFEFRDPTDPLNDGQRTGRVLGSYDFGMYYYTRKFYLGLSLNHMNARTYTFTSISEATFDFRRFNTIGAGYAFEINDKFTLRPSLLLKANDNSAASLDVNLAALLYKRIWFGVGFRDQNVLNFLLDVNVTDYFRVGYAYDAFLNSLNLSSGGAHEFFIGFDLTTDKTESVSPRYL